MGCPSAAIAFEELIQLGAGRLVRVGTCGGLQPGMRMADTVVAVAATPEDRTVFTYTNGEPHAPTATWTLVEDAVRLARERGATVHVGPIVSSAVFYDPDPGRFSRWRQRGHLGVEMEAAVLYTIAAIRGVEALTILTVSDVIEGEESTRISDEDLKRGVDDMMALACRVATSSGPEPSSGRP
jgi:5'-methylthioadenosine phosphorylase/purine-nucleoside phosphorylase